LFDLFDILKFPITLALQQNITVILTVIFTIAITETQDAKRERETMMIQDT